MGILDKFRKKEKENLQTNEETNKKQELPYGISCRRNEEGKLQVELYENAPKFGQFYDTTELIIDGDVDKLPSSAKKCRISWYGQDDAIYIDKKIGRRYAYTDIEADIDINLLQNDYNYAVSLMKSLLNQKRVERYLCDGMQENPSVQCGRYVGGIQLNPHTNSYEKYFDMQKGIKSHNSQDMINKRKEYRERKEKARQEQIIKKQEEIKKLQDEIDNMSR